MNTLSTLTLQGRAMKIIRFKERYSHGEFSHKNRLKSRHPQKEISLHVKKHCVVLETERTTTVQEYKLTVTLHIKGLK